MLKVPIATPHEFDHFQEEVSEITEAEKKALNERRNKRQHDRPAPSEPRIISELGIGVIDPPHTHSRSRQQAGHIHSRKKMQASKCKGIVTESEHDRPRKKAKTSQEGLNEDILNMSSEASKNEIIFLKTRIMAFNTTGKEKLLSFHRDVGGEGFSGGNVQGSSGENVQGTSGGDVQGSS
ncbi:hypothetical protein L1987_57646 [Smallanthus sonchifolius]|uniref:Uncharacterized protein n=1 Tax=Smallanthus sonchifolius TaxID=185202 RepID=A0ACB9DD56_9ASTR|nr:hypothetical protein L1987_57646 [Smallanthus sonchifolius]